MRLIDAEELKLQFSIKDIIQKIDNAPTVELDESVIQRVLNKRCMTAVANEYLIALHGKIPQGEWYENIPKGCLKARHGDYVLYKVDFLLDNLAREVNIMEGARRMGDKEP